MSEKRISLKCLIFIFAIWTLSFCSADAFCPDCEHRSVDVLPAVVRENDRSLTLIILVLFFLLMIEGVRRIYVRDRSLIYANKEFPSRLISFAKYFLFTLFNIIVAFLITYLFALSSYIISSLLAFFSFWGDESVSDFPFDKGKYQVAFLVIYSIIAYVYIKLSSKRSKRLNSLIIIAITLLNCWTVYVLAPLMNAG